MVKTKKQKNKKTKNTKPKNQKDILVWRRRRADPQKK